MTCPGFDCEPHEMLKPYALGLCESCYMRKYRQEHVTELRAYQEAYRSGSIYKEMRKEYNQRYKKKIKNDKT